MPNLFGRNKDADCGCSGATNAVGHPVVIWPGWDVNPARANGADINPLPIQPIHYSNWTANQLQLENGLQYGARFGKKLTYQDYLSKTYSSASSTSKGTKQILPTVHPAALYQPSQIQLAKMITDNAPTPSQTGGVGDFAPGVNLTGRTFYG